MVLSPASAVPRWSTPRRPDRPTYGPAVAQVAAAMGRTLMPHQREAADTMGEVLPSGRMAYPVCVLLWPRRAGKTDLILPTSLQRAAIDPSARAWYTAQTQSDAQETFREEWLPRVQSSPLAPHVRARLAAGSMRFTLDTGGQVGIFAPTERAMHGKDADQATVDEAWAFDAGAGARLEAAIRPTMLTRPRRQLVIISAGGTEDSTWLLEWRALGRRLVEEGASEDAGIFYQEFYPGDDDDLDDPEVWARTHPAVGHTVDLDTLRQDRATMGEALFHRSYLNVFTTADSDRVLPAEDWAACCDPLAVLPARVTIGYAVEHGRDAGAIVAAALRPDGRPGVELLWMGEVGRMADRLDALRGAGHRLVADSLGPQSTVTAELRRRGVSVDTLTTAEYTTACAEVLDDVKARRLVVRTEPRMDTAAANVARREVGDAWVWTLKRSGAGVAPIAAATVALTRARKATAARLPILVSA